MSVNSGGTLTTDVATPAIPSITVASGGLLQPGAASTFVSGGILTTGTLNVQAGGVVDFRLAPPIRAT